MERDTLYAAALVKSAINRTSKTTIGSTAAEDSSEEGIEESAIKTTNSMIKDFAGFIVDVHLFEGFSKLLPANVCPVAAGRTMRTVGTSRFHEEEGKRYMELVKACSYSTHKLIMLTIYRSISATDQTSTRNMTWPLTTLREGGSGQTVACMLRLGFCSGTHHSSLKGFKSLCLRMERVNFFGHRPGNFDGGTIMPSTALLKNSEAA